MEKIISVRENGTRRVQLKPKERNSKEDMVGVAKQEFKKECDINEIINRMKKGQLPPRWLSQKTPRYEDISNAPQSFQDAFAITQRAQEAFLSLPVGFRRDLDHDPRNLDKAPRELWEKYGLTKESEKALQAKLSPEARRVPPVETSEGERQAEGAADDRGSKAASRSSKAGSKVPAKNSDEE